MTLAMSMPRTLMCALSLGSVILLAAPAGADDALPPPVVRRSSKARPPVPTPHAPTPRATPAPRPTTAPPRVRKLPPIHPPAIPGPPIAVATEPHVAPPPKLDPDPAPPPPPPKPWQETPAARSVENPDWASDIHRVVRGEPQPAPSDDRVPPPAYDGTSPGADAGLDIPPVPDAVTPAAPQPPWAEPRPAWSAPIDASTPVPAPAPVRRGGPVVATPLPQAPAGSTQPKWSPAVDPGQAAARRAREERLFVPSVRYVPPADPDWASDITDPKPPNWQRRADSAAPAPKSQPPIRESASPALPPPAWSDGEVRWTAPARTPKAPARYTTPIRRDAGQTPPAPPAQPAPAGPPGGWSAPRAPAGPARGWSAPARGVPVAPRPGPAQSPARQGDGRPPLDRGSEALPPPPNPPPRSSR